VSPAAALRDRPWHSLGWGSVLFIVTPIAVIIALITVVGIPIGLLVLFAYIVTRPVVEVSQLPTRAGMPLAMGLIFVSLLVIISRKKALTQVIGFLMLENGIALLAALGTYGIPLIVEVGVFLDALMGFLVMQIVVYRIQQTFESLDIEQLNRLSQ